MAIVQKVWGCVCDRMDDTHKAQGEDGLSLSRRPDGREEGFEFSLGGFGTE